MVETLRNNFVKRWNYTEEHAKKTVALFGVQKIDELLNEKRAKAKGGYVHRIQKVKKRIFLFKIIIII